MMREQPGSAAKRADAAETRGWTNNLALGITVGILGVMAIAIAIDTSSVRGLSIATIVVIGGLIAALVTWG